MLVNAGICKVPRCGSGGRGISHKSHDSLLGVDQIQPLAVVRVSCCSFFCQLQSFEFGQVETTAIEGYWGGRTRHYKTICIHTSMHTIYSEKIRGPISMDFPGRSWKCSMETIQCFPSHHSRKCAYPTSWPWGMTVAICGHMWPCKSCSAAHLL